MVGRGRGSFVGRLGWRYVLRIYRSSLIGDLCHISIDMVSSVLHCLDPTIRERHLVGASHHSISITTLCSIEV